MLKSVVRYLGAPFITLVKKRLFYNNNHNTDNKDNVNNSNSSNNNKNEIESLTLLSRDAWAKSNFVNRDKTIVNFEGSFR